MLTCEFCRDRLLDYAYGLLEDNDLHEAQAHLDTCADCQAALTKVKTSKKLIARAAKAISHVPEFVLPSGEPATLPIEPGPTALPETLPLNTETPPKRPRSRHQWIAWVAVAAVVLVVAAPFVWYRNTLNGYKTDVANARVAHREIETQLAALPAKYEPLHKSAIKDTRAKAKPYLHVVGPKTLEPNAKAHLDITTRHPEGELAACGLLVKLCEAGSKNIVKIDRYQSDGHTRVEIDAAGAKPNTALNLLVEAETPFGLSQLNETVNVQAASFVTRLDTNKLLYQSRDVLFFRVLVLDRGTLQPPSQPIPLRVALVHEKKPVRTIDGVTGAGGIFAAEFAVEETYPEGSYTLEVSPVDASKTNLQSASIALEIVRDLPGIRLDQNSYARGAIVTGGLTVRGGQPVPQSVVGKLDGKAIPITLQPQPSAPTYGSGGGGFGAGRGAGGGPQAASKDASKDMEAIERFYRFATPPIPANVAPGASQLRLTVPLPSNGKKEEAATVIPLEPTDFAIDFFPEGGDLVAGVQNRVFYRVRSKSGGWLTSEGQVILLTGTNDVVDSSYQFGMGYFDFTPNLKETYTVRITTPAKVENVAAPFAKLGIRTSGVVMQVADPLDEHLPKAVGAQGDPIRVTLRRQGPPTKLLLVAHCRGQIVDQRWVELKKDPVDVTLQPTPEAHGMIRVTAYEVVDDSLEPTAERLVYRTPTHRLDLGFAPDKDRYLPGQTTTAKVSARDENGLPAAAWILASVVDERFQSKPRSLSAHFLLLNELRTGPDVENAQIVLRDSPDSVHVLERFLGTTGWRRYLPSRESAIVPIANNAALATALVFSRESMPLETMQQRYQEKVGSALTPIRTAALQEQMELESERDRRALAVNLLTGQLHNFETQMQLAIRLSLGALVGLLVIVSLTLMGVGGYRVIREHKSPTPAFGSAFACLAACLVVYFAGSFLGPMEEGQVRVADGAGPPAREGLAERLADAPKLRNLPRTVPTGDFGLRDGMKSAEKLAADSDRPGDENQMRELAKAALQNELVMNLARDRAETPTMSLRRNLGVENESQDWFNKARGVAGPPAAKAAKMKMVAPTVPIAPDKKLAKAADRLLEYPYQPGPNAIGDTLLWHPSLTLVNGSADVRFDIAPGQATYRVLLLGHGPTGRFGFFETRLDVP